MRANEIRERFLEFFRKKQHKIVPSAPMVLKDDPTLMFTNAGMNQFKDIFLGNKEAPAARVADSQKCLRVSGKHNDLEEVGHDTYHHTMFEMLGNWSFGDYFKKEAIDFAWELLTQEFGVSQERLYATIFEGDTQDGVAQDEEAKKYWQQYLPEERILLGDKKDNFWEMGDTGPCGPCSEIHIDLRDEQERIKVHGKNLVNQDHPLVIEIWNLVFIQYNRKASGDLEKLEHNHVDTGMGFERLTMALQNKTSNYDTDIFKPIINKVEHLTGATYGNEEKQDVAMRVISDHLRTIAFSIAEGQLPSNNKAGYVIRRILRRAVRYAYTFLQQNNPFIYQLVPVLIDNMGQAYPELKSQREIIEKVIHEEEASFLKTLDTGIRMLDRIIEQTRGQDKSVIDGRIAFELYDTYGFPGDLTRLILKEHNMDFDQQAFNKAMEEQKARSRNASVTETGDWTIIREGRGSEFVGYEHTEARVYISKYRQIKSKKKTFYQLVFDKTPFYAESGGQVGDTGYITDGDKKITITDTIKEHDSTVHITTQLPSNIEAPLQAVVTESKRRDTERNHSATHLLHYALRQVLGNHVEQKGSLVAPDYLRFDFSHFQKLTDEDIKKVEHIVNDKIRQNIQREEKRELAFEDAVQLGATALFGEKYGDQVRVIQFGDSIELCGGTHVSATGKIGFFKITSEAAISAGIRRIEAVTGAHAEAYVQKQHDTLKAIHNLLKSPKDVVQTIAGMQEENANLRKQVEIYEQEKAMAEKQRLLNSIEEINGMQVISGKVNVNSADSLKNIAFNLRNEVDNLFLVAGAEIKGKPNLAVMISDNLVKTHNLHAGNIVKNAAKSIKGGGGGQPFFATAGGKDVNGLDEAIEKARANIEKR